MSDVQVFLNNYYFRLLNGEQKPSSQCLSVLNNILSEMRNIVVFINEMEDCSDDDLWWDNTHQSLLDVFEDVDNDQSDSDCSYQKSCLTSQDYSVTSSCSSFPSLDISSDSNSTTSLSNLDGEMRKLEDEIFIDSMLNFIDTVAPKSKFNKQKSKRRRMKKMKKLIHPHLRTMWSNSNAIVSQSPPTPVSTSTPRYPIIDWSKVNEKFIKNIPRPQRFPLHGCLNIHDVENEDYSCGIAPHGYGIGYLTNLGIIAPLNDNQIVHGYMSTDAGWILHAQYPKEKKKTREKREKEPTSRVRMKRKKGLR